MKTINKYFKKIRRYLFHKVAGKKRSQPFFEKLYQISLSGMNFGYFDIKINGEKQIIGYTKFLSKDITPVIFDVGASIGDYSSAVISILDNKVDLYSFEPSKKAFSILEENISNNKNVKIYNFGFGEKEEKAILYSDQKGSPVASLFNRFENDLVSTCKEEVRIKRLDDFCKENGISHMDLLKIDVEGNELNVLKGAKNMIESCAIDLIQFEFSKFHISSKVYFKDFFYFLSPNYKIYRILRDGLQLMEKYNERYEIFTVINYLAVSKNISVLNLES